MPKVEDLCTARVVFLPKTAQPSTPAEFRPIGISSVYVRLWHRILAARWTPTANLPELQFAFQRRDGVFEAVSSLHLVLRHAVESYSGLVAASLDLTKAFDTVSRFTIIRAAQSNGCPPPLLQYLSAYYESATVLLGDRRVRCGRGVRQGDPLSPLLFTLVMKEAAEGLPSVPFRAGQVVANYFAYADDLVLLARSDAELRVGLQHLVGRFASAGLQLNPAKSRVLRIAGNRHIQKTACDSSRFIFNSDSTIEALGPEDSLRILGVPMCWNGLQKINHLSLLKRCLDEVSAAPLKPQQRLEVLRVFLFPKYLHQLVCGNVSVSTLRAMDVAFRLAVRRWLRLPSDSSSAFLHAPIREGGLGVPSFRTTVVISKRSRIQHLLASPHAMVRAVGAWLWRSPVAALARRPLVVEGRTVVSRAEAHLAWTDAWRRTLDGRGLTSPDPVSVAWVRDPSRIFPRVFLRGVALRAGTLSNKVRASRGRPPSDVR